MYQGGKTEKVLGTMGVGTNPSFSLTTKVNPWFSMENKTTMTEPARGLRKEAITYQLHESLRNLKMDKVPLLYLHAPDHETPIQEILETLNELYKNGKFEEWGLSNYAAWQVVHIYHLCKSKNYVLPTVYQGMYNYITRDIERELIPALRTCGMRFYAYNPLAGGILTGRYSFDDDPSSGRFSGKTVWGTRYRERYWKKSMFDELDHVKAACEKHSLDLTYASISWLMFHSELRGDLGDGVIIGGSTVEQIEKNTEICKKAQPLPEEVVSVIGKAWEVARPDCPKYFR